MALKSLYNKDGSAKGLKHIYKKTTTSTKSTNNLGRQVSNLQTRLDAVGADTDTRNWIQKTLNLREGSGFLEGVGDVLERGTGLASIKAAIAGDPTKSGLENAWDAFLGNQRYTGTDVIDAIDPTFKNASGVERFLGGMAADLLLDPATYLSLGASAVTKSATTQGAKALGMLDDAGRVATGSTKALKDALTTTKTVDQAADLVKGADKVQDLLSASKAYRAADVADTIANPLKLVGKGAKKGGELTMKALDKFAPEKATAVRELGKQAKQIFDYKGFLQKSFGDKEYKSYDNAKQIADLSKDFTVEGSAKQQKKFETMLKNIKKDINRVWTTTSNIDGSKGTFTFKGMTDDEIMKNLKDFAVNEIYFDRPKFIGEDTIRSLIQNKGRAALAIDDFKDPKEANKLLKQLQDILPEPDKVEVRRYIQPDTGKATGYIIDIGSTETGSKNVKALQKFLSGFDDDIVRQEGIITKGEQRIAKAQGLLDKNQTRLAEKQQQLSDLEQQLLTASGNTKERLLTKRDNLMNNIEKLQNNITKRTDKVSSLQGGLDVATQQLENLGQQQSQLDELLKPREVVPYYKPKIDIPEMEDVAKIQREMTDMDLGIRHAGNVDMKSVDKYEQYMHRSLTPEAQAYIAKNNVKRSPDIVYMTMGTDKIPSQSYYTNIYGNASPTEVNTMIGKDIFDNSLIASNVEKVKSLNRRTNNFTLTKAVFSGDNDLIKPITKDLPMEEFTKLREQGYEMFDGNKVAQKLSLADMLDPEDYAKITKDLKGKQFYVSKDAIDIMQKNKKLLNKLTMLSIKNLINI